MNSNDPWRPIVGGPHHHGGGGHHHGGGHHGHHGGGRRYFGGGGYSYPYWEPYYREPSVVVVDNRRYFDAQGRLIDSQGRLIDAQGRLIVSGHHGGGGHGGGHHHHQHHGGGQQRRQFIDSGNQYGGGYPADLEPSLLLADGQGAGDLSEESEPAADGTVVVGTEPLRPRDGLLAAIAPAIAPATGGILARFELDNAHRLTAVMAVDGKTYQGTVDLAPVIAALLVKFATKPATPAAPGTTVAGGDCGARLFYSVTAARLNAIFKRLGDEGAQITGNNPWEVDTHNHGVRLRGTWNRGAQTLLLEVVDSDFIAPCDAIWSTLGGMLTSMGLSPTPVAPPTTPAPSRAPQAPQQQQPPQAPSRPVPSSSQAILAIDRAIAAARASLVESLVQQHVDTVSQGWLDAVSSGEWGDTMSAGWFDKLKHAASKSWHGVPYHGTIAKTFRKYQEPIARAAGLAAGTVATIYGGPAAGIIANGLTNKLVHAAAGNGNAQQALLEARTAALRDPKLAKALGTAEKAVAQTTAAYHIAETARAASAGDQNAASEIGKLDTAAKQGDKAAQVAMQLANQAASADAGQNQAAPAVSGEPEDALDMYRAIAITAILRALATTPGAEAANTLGYLRRGKKQSVYFFASHKDAFAWYHKLGPDLTYQAVFDAREVMERGREATPLQDSTGFTTTVSGPGGRPIIRVPVLVDGELSKMFALWVLPYKSPDYYVLDNDPAWLFEDPMGGIELSGRRFRIEYPITKPTLTGDVPPGIASAAVNASVGTGGPRVEIIGAVADPNVEGALATVRKQASDAAANYPGRYIGIVRWADGSWSLSPFTSSDDADDWFGGNTNQPHLFTYAAYYDKYDATFPKPLNEAFGHARPAHHAQPIPRGVAVIGVDPAGVHSPTSTSTEVRSPTSTSTEVRSPTSTSTEVRSPTSTSTDAYTQGNVTVTGGAGAGATNVYIGVPPPPQDRRADEAAHLERSHGVAWRPENLMRETGAPRPEQIQSTMGPTDAPRATSPIPDMMNAVSSDRAPSPMAHMVSGTVIRRAKAKPGYYGGNYRR